MGAKFQSRNTNGEPLTSIDNMKNEHEIKFVLKLSTVKVTLWNIPGLNWSDIEEAVKSMS